MKTFTWATESNHFYFSAHSNNLTDWAFFPEAWEGNGENASITAGSNTKFFFRAYSSNLPYTGPIENADPDGDGLSVIEELRDNNTSPAKSDTDGNGVSDAEEDIDGDGYTSLEEIRYIGTSPKVANPELRADSDGDGIEDGFERIVIARSENDPYSSLASIALSNVNTASGLHGESASSRLTAEGELEDQTPALNIWTEWRQINVSSSSSANQGNGAWSRTSSPDTFVSQSSGDSVSGDPGARTSEARSRYAEPFPSDSADDVLSENWLTSISLGSPLVGQISSEAFDDGNNFQGHKSQIRLVADRPIEQGEQPPKQNFLKIRRTFTQTPPDTDTIEILETVELEIPVGEDKSPLLELKADSYSSNGYRDTINPIFCITDINNDGIINATDNALRDAAFGTGATDEVKDKGTEFLLVNDAISNGLWDKEDIANPDKPASETEDDDAKEIKLDPGIPEGEVWLEHPAMVGLSFYKSRECLEEDKISLSSDSKFAISLSTPFPDQLFVRADGEIPFPEENPQVEGDLVLKAQLPNNPQEIEIAKMKLTVVKQLGAQKYFHAVRDYIFENNVELYTSDLEVKNDARTALYRMTFMAEELTSLNPLDIYDHEKDEPRIRGGLDELAGLYPVTVILSGNFCWSTKGTAQILRVMTDRCEGRISTGGGVLWPPSSDDHHPELGGPTACYVSCDNALDGVSDWKFATGRLPDNDQRFGMGGLASKYDTLKRQTDENSIVGRAPVIESGKGLIFTASNEINSGGNAIEFTLLAINSGVESLSGSIGNPDRYELLFLDGGSTVGLAYANPSGEVKTSIKGGKQYRYAPLEFPPGAAAYRVNTYLLFDSSKPRLK